MKKHAVILLIIVVPVLIFTIFYYGCGTSPTSPGNGGPTAISKLYLTGGHEEIIIFNVETLSTEESILLSNANAETISIAISKDKKTLYILDYQANVLYSKNINSGAEETININSYDNPHYDGSYAAVSPDGQRVFISAYTKGGVFSFLTSPFSLEAFATTESGTGICTGVLAMDNYAYIGDYGASLLLRYNIPSKEIDKAIPVPENGKPYSLRLSADKNKIYVPTKETKKVFIFNIAECTFEAESIYCSDATTANYLIDIGITSGGKGYVTNYDKDKVYVVNLADNSVTKIITLEASTGPMYAIVDEARHRVYIDAYDRPRIFVIDTVNDTLEATYTIPKMEDTDGFDQVAVE